MGSDTGTNPDYTTDTSTESDDNVTVCADIDSTESDDNVAVCADIGNL